MRAIWRRSGDVRRTPATPGALRERSAGSDSRGSVTREDTVRWVHDLVEHLPEKYAQVVRLCALEELTFVEAGQRLGLAADTVRKRYERAREVLERKLSARHDG